MQKLVTGSSNDAGHKKLSVAPVKGHRSAIQLGGISMAMLHEFFGEDS